MASWRRIYIRLTDGARDSWMPFQEDTPVLLARGRSGRAHEFFIACGAFRDARWEMFEACACVPIHPSTHPPIHPSTLPSHLSHLSHLSIYPRISLVLHPLLYSTASLSWAPTFSLQRDMSPKALLLSVGFVDCRCCRCCCCSFLSVSLSRSLVLGHTSQPGIFPRALPWEKQIVRPN